MLPIEGAWRSDFQNVLRPFLCCCFFYFFFSNETTNDLRPGILITVSWTKSRISPHMTQWRSFIKFPKHAQIFSKTFPMELASFSISSHFCFVKCWNDVDLWRISFTGGPVEIWPVWPIKLEHGESPLSLWGFSTNIPKKWQECVPLKVHLKQSGPSPVRHSIVWGGNVKTAQDISLWEIKSSLWSDELLCGLRQQSSPPHHSQAVRFKSSLCADCDLNMFNPAWIFHNKLWKWLSAPLDCTRLSYALGGPVGSKKDKETLITIWDQQDQFFF